MRHPDNFAPELGEFAEADSVAPLVQSTWGQGDTSELWFWEDNNSYNKYCPWDYTTFLEYTLADLSDRLRGDRHGADHAILAMASFRPGQSWIQSDQSLYLRLQQLGLAGSEFLCRIIRLE